VDAATGQVSSPDRKERNSPEDVARIPALNPFVTFASFCSNPLLPFCDWPFQVGRLDLFPLPVWNLNSVPLV
jgi:hypothetical protein